MTIRHVVTWQLAADDPATKAEHAAEIVRRLKGLVGVVPSIRALSVGADVVDPEGNADVALVADFDDITGLQEYQTHPAHREAGSYIGSVVSGRSCVDFEV